MLLLLALGGSAAAATYYVGGTGSSDANDGSQASPWATISYAASQVAAGDLLLVAPGDYDESVAVTRGGSADLPVTFRSRLERRASVRQFDVQADFVTIDGFEITNSFSGTTGFGVSCGQTHYGTARDGCRIINNYIHDLDDTGIYSGTNGFVRGNLIRRADRGIFLNSGSTALENEVDTLLPVRNKTQYTFFVGDDISILGNYFHGTDMLEARDHGVDFFTTFDGWTWGASHNILIEDNICYESCHACEPSGGYLDDSGPITFRNNLFVDTVYVGIYCQFFKGITIENNTFVNCGAYPVWFQSLREVENSVVLNNVMTTWNHDPTQYGGQAAESGVRINTWLLPYAATGTVVNFNMMYDYRNRAYGANDFTAEPLFVDPDKGDFRFRPSSPGIDAGTVTGATTDQNGTVRPHGSGVDVGAYEFHR
jgi:parallel beta-helix repeat protein